MSWGIPGTPLCPGYSGEGRECGVSGTGGESQRLYCVLGTQGESQGLLCVLGTQGRGGTVGQQCLLYSGTGGNPRDSTVSWGLRGGEELWDSSGGTGTGGNPRDSSVSWGLRGGKGQQLCEWDW